MPDLRIVDEDLWQAARRRQEEISKQFEHVTKGVRAYRARHVNELHRPAFLFSGLLKCGGGNYGLITRDRYGCLNRYRRGTCDNGPTIRRDDIEQRILSGLTERLVSADRGAKAVRAYAEALNSQNRERRAQAELDRKALEKVERGVAGIMAAIEDGMYEPAMKDRMEDLERRKAEILARMEQAPEDVPDIHPNIAEIYKAKVTQLSEALADPELRDQAAEAFRALVDEVVLEPGDKCGEVNATLRGEVMNILDIVAGRKTRSRSQVITKDVASPRNHLYLRPRSPCCGVFALRGNRKDSSKIALYVDLHLALDRRQHDLVNKRAQRVSRPDPLPFVFVLQDVVELLDPLAVLQCHARVQQGWWLVRFGQEQFKFLLTFLDRHHLRVERVCGSTL